MGIDLVGSLESIKESGIMMTLNGSLIREAFRAFATAVQKKWDDFKAFFQSVKERMSKVIAISKRKGIIRIPYEACYSGTHNRVIASGTKHQAHRTLIVRRRTS